MRMPARFQSREVARSYFNHVRLEFLCTIVSESRENHREHYGYCDTWNANLISPTAQRSVNLNRVIKEMLKPINDCSLPNPKRL